MDNIFAFILARKYVEIGLLFIVIVILVIAINNSRKPTKSKKQYTLDDCKSYEDLEFKIDTYQNNLKDELTKNKKVIHNAKKKGYIKADTVWIERFQELTEISNILYKNLEYENAKKLNIDKFHRYTSLHFRSVILGNFAYKDYCDSKQMRDEIGYLLVAIGKRQIQVTATEKKELYSIKDTCVKTTRYLYDRMVIIQKETGILRDKIFDECGSRGKEWYKKIQRNKGK